MLVIDYTIFDNMKISFGILLIVVMFGLFLYTVYDMFKQADELED